MDVAGLDLLQILYVILSIAGVLGLFGLVSALKTYVQQRMGQNVTYNWKQILDYVPLAVQAVEQIRKVKPAGMSDTEWNDVRLNNAINIIKAYGISLGFNITDEFVLTVRGVIEATIARSKKPESVVLGTPLPLFNTTLLNNGLITG